jgi:hypothetical protein
MRKMASSLKPILHVTQEGKNWTIKTESTFKTVELAFQDGVEFAEETLDGRKSKTTITYHDNGQLVQEQRNPETGAVVAKITRQVDANDKMHIVSHCFKWKNLLQNHKRISQAFIFIIQRTT